jgi:beta-1,4-mannosyl-glycoprotein beta-1,4-N-acetylglucosaminyltransferase|tara:strand:+ start:186 stop:992 length:807 start_codon:yes stop_codon:yes gene_type:complete
MKNKIFDCITFFRENFITNLRFEILNEVVDYFVICESRYDHQGKSKELNFSLKNPKFKEKIIYLVLEEQFKNKNNPWKNQAEQREHIINGLKKAEPEDYIMFSDPDEIPRPEILKELMLNKVYGIFQQDLYCYKFNIFNKHETPWAGTRVCRKKNLTSIDYMRQQVKYKNLSAPFWKFYKEKSIQIISNGGWHFNCILTPKEISRKLKTFAHTEVSGDEFSSLSVIEKNILEKKDLFQRGKYYEKVDLDKTFPKYILENISSLKEWIV